MRTIFLCVIFICLVFSVAYSFQQKEVPDKEVILICRTYPSFDYVKYQGEFYEAIPQIGGTYILSHKFENVDKFIKAINGYKRNSKPIMTYENESYFFMGYLTQQDLETPVRFCDDISEKDLK